MEPIGVNTEKDGFEVAGRPCFYLADTLWSAFTNVSLSDWERYLVRRSAQGFNAVQINTLVQADRSVPDLGIYPYASDDGSQLDFLRPNESYWERAHEMCAMAAEHGIRPVLVLLWANMVPQTWIARELPEHAQPMPFEEIRRHVERVVLHLGEFDPIFFIGGDTDLEMPETQRWYGEALDVLCESSPDSLKSFHLQRGTTFIPERFVDRLDFFTFQSGHNPSAQARAWTLPQEFEERYPRKPIVNAEPCYEQMGYSRFRYGRFDEADVRAMAWSSVLSGASAGVTYGAHGVWSWMDEGSKTSPMGEIFDTPMRWDDALGLPGAWDFGLVPRLLGLLGFRHPMPLRDCVQRDTDRIRVAEKGGRYLAYLPCATTLRLSGILGDFDVTALDLQDKRVATLRSREQDGALVIERHPFAHDALLLLEPRGW